ncbi:MAG TPA: mechanosensitive ion channel family protein [Acidimicrobiia bacterium]|nr:mechanosensitive ion channel family protein [Acidimicrobiia bacterium]
MRALLFAHSLLAQAPPGPSPPGQSETEGGGGDILPDRLAADDWIQAAAIFVAAIVLAILVRRIITRFVARGETERHAALVIGRFVSALIVAGGFVYALNALGVRLGPLLGALGIGGVALAFALQHVLENWFSAVLLQIRRPFRVGDQIVAEGFSGTVEDINFRAVVIRSVDGRRVHLPASTVVQNPFENLTAYGRRRTTLTVGLAYDADLGSARQVLLDAVASAEGVTAYPPPEAWVEQFGESSIDVAVRFWHPARIADEWRVRSNVAVAVKEALDAAGIAIPFPQRTLHFAGMLDPADDAGHDDRHDGGRHAGGRHGEERSERTHDGRSPWTG